MATGRNIQLARQIGEYLVAAELGRRGWIATTFTGSLPGYDILAVNEDDRVLEVQVKTLRSGTWQMDAGHFIEIALDGDTQRIVGPKPIKTAGRIFVFVKLGGTTGEDAFYLCTLQELQKLLLETYKAGKRPNNPTTRHHAVPPKQIAHFRDNWSVLDA